MAGDLGEIFVKMKNEYNMSNMQIAEMGRGMKDVARYTGLTGKELGKPCRVLTALYRCCVMQPTCLRLPPRTS